MASGNAPQRVAFIAAGVFLLASLVLPWWQFKVVAPQYPKGLKLTVYVNRVEGDVREINLLNHYIGMKPLDKAAQVERKVSVPGIAAIVLLLFVASFSRCKLSVLLSLPALLLPFVFAADLFFWLWHYGTHLDPEAPIRLKPFIPKLIGVGKIAQFQTQANFLPGFYLSAIASALIIAGYLVRFRSYLASQKLNVSRKFISVLLIMLSVLVSRESLGRAEPSHPSSHFARHAHGSRREWVVSKGGLNLEEALRRAQDGDVIIVEGGVHEGNFVVTKSVSLVGRNSPVLDGGNKGTVVTIKARNVSLSGFVIRSSGNVLSQEDAGVAVEAPNCRVENNRLEEVLFGIVLRNAPKSLVLNNELRGKDLHPARRGDLIKVWYSNGVRIEGNKVVGGRDVVLWFSKDLTIRRNKICQGRYGIHFMYCDDATVEANRITENAVGIYLMYSQRLRLLRNWLVNNRGPSGYGIGLKDMREARIVENVVADNRVGIFAEGAVLSHFEGNLLAYNDVGFFLFTSSHSNSMVKNSFVENGEQVYIEGAMPAHANRWQNNYWSDYHGYDADGDGIGDLPYKPVRLFESLVDRQSALKLFSFSLVSHCFPIFALQPKLVDPSPLTEPLISGIVSPATQKKSPHLLLFGVLTVLLALGLCKVKVSPKGGLSQITSRESRIALRVNGLTKRFGEFVAVNHASFIVRKGQAVALWGPNGAGKTTILRCILGLYRFDGEIFVMGHDVSKEGKLVRNLIGYLPQEINLYDDLTVFENLNFYASLRKVDKERLEILMDEWRLKEIADKPVGQLSGGMKQRLAFALALLSDPPLLLLDEPTANLDAQTRREVWSFMSQLKRSGKTLVFCSHRADEVLRLADYVLVLEKGTVVAEGKPDELIDILKEQITLKLTVAKEYQVAAEEILQRHGFNVSLDGTQLLVTVPKDRKALPIQILSVAGIHIQDFDLEEEPAR